MKSYDKTAGYSLIVMMSEWINKMLNLGGQMRASEKSEGHILITSNKQIKNIEAHCRKVHAEAVIESIKLAFSAPTNVADKLFSKKKGSIDRGQTASS